MQMNERKYLITHDIDLVQHAIVIDELLQTPGHGHLQHHRYMEAALCA